MLKVSSRSMVLAGLSGLMIAPMPSMAQRPGEVMVPSSYVVPGRVAPQRPVLHLVREEPGKETVGFAGMRRRQLNRDPETYSNPAAADPGHDPLRGINKIGYGINKGLNVAVEQPATTAYRTVVPQPVRRSVRNFVNNFGAPVSIVNQVGQGKVNSAGVEITRFGVNSTLGLLGIFDVAKKVYGIEPTPREDFGQTLGKYGVPAGPPLEVPVLGNSNPRDLGGFVADWTLAPAVTPGAGEDGVGPAVGIAARLSVLDSAGPTAAYPAPRRGQTPYSARREAAINRRNAEIAR
jgi:phospholipid-binding lipoprotein MlaA